MKTLIFTLIAGILAFYTPTLQAQDSITFPDDLEGWQTSWTVGINGSQASYSNWAQGGVNNIAATGSSNFSTVYKTGRFSYGFLLDTRFGKTRIQDEGTRKIDDRLLLKNRFLYDLGGEESDFKLFANIRFRTQFDKGFDYASGEDGSNTLISNFMAPAYFTQDAGLAYVPVSYFSVEAGLGLQQTFVRDRSLSETYGLAEGDRFRSEAGFTFGASFDATIAENLSFSSSINTFTNMTKSVKSTDVYFSNKLTGRVNDFMNTSLNLDLVYDDNFSNKLQVAQVLSLGISFILR